MANALANRIDLASIRDRIDLPAIATALWGPAPKRSGRRLLWRCVFHDDHDPSLEIDPERQRWKCWPCNLGGDAIELVMKVRGLAFPDAVQAVAELAGIATPSSKPARPRPPARSDPARPSVPTDRPPVRAAERPPDKPTGLDRQEAERLVADASERIWTPEGADARRYLEGRGLSPATIRRHRLGWADRIRLPKRDGDGTWTLAGITFPWIDSGRLTRVKVRRVGLFKGSRYIEAFGDRWRIYPGPEAIRPGVPLVICEGEPDALLLGQELAGLASVATFGSTSARPDASMWLALARCSPLYVALDADPSGDDTAAREWGGRSIRVRPPAGKDWTEALQAGIDLRRWWIEEHFPAEFDRLERASIYEFDAGMSREQAERAAGLRSADA